MFVKLQSREREVDSLKTDLQQKTASICALEHRCQQSTDGNCLMLLLVLAGTHVEASSKIDVLSRCDRLG